MYQKAENQAIGASFALSLSPPPCPLSPYLLTHRCRSHAVLQEEKEGEQLNTQRSSKSLVHTLSGIVWFLVEFWTGIVLEHDVQSKGVCSKWQGRDGRKHTALGTFSFVLESDRCGCQQRNAVNRKGRKGKGNQTSTAEQYLKHHSTRRKFSNRFSELLEASAV